MRVLVVGNASLSDLILKVGGTPGQSSVAPMEDSPGRHATWLPGGAATTIALAIRERGHEVELCHPLPSDPLYRPSLAELMRRGIGIGRSPLVQGEVGRCVIVYGPDNRLAWSTPPEKGVEIDPRTILSGIDYVVFAPVWSDMAEQIALEASRHGVPAAMIGEFAPGAAAIDWDLVVLDRAQREMARTFTAKTIVVTDGAAGSTVTEGRETFHVDALRIVAVDTTGAGDTYGGAFVGARLAGQDVHEAASFATGMAAKCCEGDGSWAAYTSPPTAPLPASVTVRDRVLGAVWGMACGDAFGMPNSFLNDLPWLTEMVPGPANSPYHAGYPAGRITDDTEQGMALTEAMLIDFTPTTVAAKLNEWFIGVGGEKSLAVGPSTKRAMLAFAQGGNVMEIGRLGVTNGSAMRVAPIGVVAGLRAASMEELLDLVEISCIPTHNTSVAISGAGAIAAAVSAAIGGAAWDEVIAQAIEGAKGGVARGTWIYAPDVDARIRLALRIAEASGTAAEFTNTLSSVVGTGEPCTESVPAAIAAAHFAKGDPAYAIELCANSRGDTDTTAAMAGAICGAFMGWRAIPESWRIRVEQVNQVSMNAWADKLERAAAK